MNLLAQIVPGLRDTRVPVSVGILWAAVIWLLVANPTYQTALDPAHHYSAAGLVAQVKQLPEGAAVSVAVLGVYILGVLMEILAPWLLRAALVPIGYAFIIGSIAFVSFLVAHPLLWALPSALWLVVTQVVFAVKFRQEWSAKAGWRFAGYLLIITAETARPLFERLRRVDPLRQGFRELIDREIERELSHRNQLLSRLIPDDAPRHLLVYAMSRWDLSNSDLRSAAPSLQLADNMHPIHAMAVCPGPEVQRAAAQALVQMAADNLAMAISLVRLFADIRPLEARLERTLREAANQLKVKRESLWNEYDRLQSEGAFRSGVALGVAALVLTLASRFGAHLLPPTYRITVNGIAYGDPIPDLVGVAAVVLAPVAALVLHYAGASKTRESRDHIYICVKTGLVELPGEPLPPSGLIVTARPLAPKSPSLPTRLLRGRWLRPAVPGSIEGLEQPGQVRLEDTNMPDVGLGAGLDGEDGEPVEESGDDCLDKGAGRQD